MQSICFDPKSGVQRLVISLPSYSEKGFWRAQGYYPRQEIQYIPVVLSRREIDSVLKHLEHPYDLVVKLLYGCGLRLFECVNLRVKNFNFDDGILTVHGKGSKDRTVPIPQTIMPELTAQLEEVRRLHDEDMAAGFAGVFLDDRLEKKYPSARKAFIWQWFFPQQSLTYVEETKERRRYHLHETHVQLSLYEAVRGGEVDQAHHLAHLPPQFCHPPSAGQL